MMLWLLTSLALAGARSLDMTLQVDGVAISEGSYVLPTQPESVEFDVEGAPHLATATFESRHGTVRVHIRVDELKGKKRKPSEVTALELTLYEDYPGVLDRSVEGSAYKLEAVWTDTNPKKTRLEVPPVPPEALEAPPAGETPEAQPAGETPAEEPAG